jgi:hypothetical protein
MEPAIGNFYIYLATNPPDAADVRRAVAEMSASAGKKLHDMAQRCDGGVAQAPALDAQSCSALGRWMHEWSDVTGADGAIPTPLSSIDVPGGVPLGYLLGKACKAGDAAACRDMFDVFGGICDEASGTGCNEFADKLLDGAELPKDVARGMALHERACNYGDRVGCITLAVMYDLGIEVARDGSRAADFYQKGCWGWSPKSCGVDSPWDRYFSPRIKEGLAQRQCEAGMADACERLKMLRARK